jgi:glycerol-3-phosphate dehydrogenase
VLKEVPGYADITAKDTEYVLEEAGFKARADVDFDEFLEVCFIRTNES